MTVGGKGPTPIFENAGYSDRVINNMLKTGRIILLSFFLALAGLFSLCPAHAGSYRFVTLEYPPYEYSEDGIIKGMAVEIVTETFKSMGHDVKIEIWPWARSIEMLKNGEADGIFTFFKTPEREEFTHFSKEVLLSQKMSFWVKNNSVVTFDGDLSRLQNYKFGVVRKTSYGSIFDNAVKNGTLKVYESYTIEECINQLINGRIDIWVSNRAGAAFELKKAGKYLEVREVIPIIQNIPAFVGFSKKRHLEELRNDFDKALSRFKKSLKYSRIVKKYSS
jgi:polar amino acid transport system substrate-binding protein